jgi:fatty-acyl-CoA synthase
MEMTPDDVQLTYLPLFHIYAIGYSVFMSFMSGASQVLMDHFNGDEALRLIAKHRVTMFHGFEAHISDLLAARSRVDADIGSLRTATIAAGAESMVALVRRAQQDLCPTLSSYGLSEVWGGVTISPTDASMSQRCEASGLPQSGVEIRIVDPESGIVLPAGAVGEIQIRSYSCMIGYHQNLDATVAAFDEGGWFRTGDAGLMRDDGHLRWLARYKDMLKVGGENVAPAEIEELLCRIPGVQAVAVVGQRQERLQEVPIAFVVASATSRPTEQSIRDYFRGKIASFKIPSRVIFVDELPMTSTGKVQKEVLRKRLADGIG